MTGASDAYILGDTDVTNSLLAADKQLLDAGLPSKTAASPLALICLKKSLLGPSTLVPGPRSIVRRLKLEIQEDADTNQNFWGSCLGIRDGTKTGVE